MAAMRGTSVSSSSEVAPFDTSIQIKMPVNTITNARITVVGRAFHTRNP